MEIREYLEFAILRRKMENSKFKAALEREDKKQHYKDKIEKQKIKNKKKTRKKTRKKA
jgi:hypothetical protein